MDLEREELRHNYRLCRAGFALIALGLTLLSLDSGCLLAGFLMRSRDLWSLRLTTWWDWLVGAPITWCTLVGSYLLLGRSSDPVWQRRAGLLVIMNGIDMIVWTLHHG